jgi:hypothetical protein
MARLMVSGDEEIEHGLVCDWAFFLLSSGLPSISAFLS